MPHAVWNDIYSVNIKEIDDQHKALVDFINQGYDHVANSSTDPKIYSDFFDNLIAYANFHFGTEEKYFEKFNFELALEHILRHNDIKATIARLQSNYQQTHSIDVIFDTLHLIDDWLFEHIMDYDKKYVDCFVQHGLK